MKQLTPLYLIILLVMLLCPSSYGAQDNETMEVCNLAYNNGQFEKAITCYQKIDQHGFSSALLYNIGNGYAQLGQIGNAVLYYQRALCLSPGDSDISGNLALIRNEEGLFVPEPKVIETIAGFLSIAQWSLLVLAAFTAYLIFTITQLKTRQSRAVELATIICCIIFAAIGGTGAAMQYTKWNQSVVVSDSKLLLSPFDNAPPSGIIKQGRMVLPHKVHNAFQYVTDETGRKGWIPNKDITAVLPPDN